MTCREYHDAADHTLGSRADDDQTGIITMYVGMSLEQQEFAQACRKLLERECAGSVVREFNRTPTGHAPDVYAAVAELGWFDLALSTDSDLGGLVELGIAYRAAGRFLPPTTIYATIWGALLLRASEVSRWNDQIAAGEIRLAVAYAEAANVDLTPGSTYDVIAQRDASGWRLSGTKLFAQAAHGADLILVPARLDGGHVGLFAVANGLEGLTTVPMQTFAGDPQAIVEMRKVLVGDDALVKGPLDDATWSTWFSSVADQACALQCMEMLGGAERVLDDTAAYIRNRHVFGRPVGTFQAAQHHIANMGISLAAARVAAYRAIDAASSGEPAFREVSVAKSWLSKAYKEVTVLAHQLHGAIGYARETDLHLWSERAKTTELTFGDRTYHLRRIADALVGPVADAPDSRSGTTPIGA